MIAIPLARAMVCVSCNCVVPLQPRCPACGSGVLMSLARWLERIEEVAK